MCPAVGFIVFALGGGFLVAIGIMLYVNVVRPLMKYSRPKPKDDLKRGLDD